ncbi:MAG: hypothetical protein JXR73_20215 [Candidatus Omnitrophica bacterium]|nr:hypothetical protein [Candidatus Omnitrophota bacterium]
MIDRDEANRWIERLMDGETIPPDVEDFIRQNSECRDYQAALEKAVSALESLNIPDPPAGLTDRIMDFIAEREASEQYAAPQKTRPRNSIWLDVWKACFNLIPDVSIPKILQREAVPAMVSGFVVLFGLFIGPQVEAGKNIVLLERAKTYANWMMEESDRISYELNSKADGLINHVTEVIQKSIKREESNSDNDINQNTSSYRNMEWPQFASWNAWNEEIDQWSLENEPRLYL